MIVAVTMCVFVSPLVVAGIVIGLVLFLSLIIIIIGSMRKKKQSHLSDTADGFSFGGSTGDLRSECVDEFPPVFDFDSYTETIPVPQSSSTYPDAPPHYDECVGRHATHIFTPTDDPPPYSHTSHTHPSMVGAGLPEGASSWWSAHAHASSHRPVRMQDISSVFVLSLDELPPYEAVVEQQDRTIPVIGNQDPKHTTGLTHTRE